MYFSELNPALKSLCGTGSGTMLAQDRDDGSKEYFLFATETASWDWYSNKASPRIHAVNFSCLSNATSRFYMDYDSPKSSYTKQDESNKHKKRIRKFIKTVMDMLNELEISRYVEWVMENRTRFVPDKKLYKTSFHVYGSFTFPNNYEILPAFVTAAANHSGLNLDFIDFSVYQPKTLLSVIGSSSKELVLPQASEEDFYLSLTASMSEFPDITTEHMEKLNINWSPRVLEERLPSIWSVDAKSLKQRMLTALKAHGETIQQLLLAPGTDRYYSKSTVGRRCLTFPGETHRSNRCVVWLHEGRLFYKCLDPEHIKNVYCLGDC
jgi:hypothetical protein